MGELHQFQTGGTCSNCGQLWPCQEILALADRLSEQTRKAAREREVSDLATAITHGLHDLDDWSPYELAGYAVDWLRDHPQ